MDDFRAHVGTWAARTSWRAAQGQDSNGQAINYIGNMLLCAAALTVLIVTSGEEQNPGPGVEAERRVCKYCAVGVTGI
jgi:hypothetical protein